MTSELVLKSEFVQTRSCSHSPCLVLQAVGPPTPPFDWIATWPVRTNTQTENMYVLLGGSSRWSWNTPPSLPPARNTSIRWPAGPGAFDGTRAEQTVAPPLLVCMVQPSAAE